MLAAEDTTMRLAEAHADSFDAEKHHYTDGLAAGHDMSTQAGREAYLRQWRRNKMAAMQARAGGPRLNGSDQGRATPGPAQHRKRKAARKSPKRNR